MDRNLPYKYYTCKPSLRKKSILYNRYLMYNYYLLLHSQIRIRIN